MSYYWSNYHDTLPYFNGDVFLDDVAVHSKFGASSDLPVYRGDFCPSTSCAALYLWTDDQHKLGSGKLDCLLLMSYCCHYPQAGIKWGQIYWVLSC